jgi:hypothetical protein
MASKYMKLLMIAGLLLAALFLVVCSSSSSKPEMTKEELVQRGEFLVNIGGCNDCHSPKIMTDLGPVPDTTRLLSGFQAGTKLPEVPYDILTPTAWGTITNQDFTAWAGPWGVSFTANLTPDQVTGSGAWTESAFIAAMRTGKHLGAGRPILPPMPWQPIGKLPDQDLKAIFAYLHSLKPINNMVPIPLPPGQQQQKSE